MEPGLKFFWLLTLSTKAFGDKQGVVKVKVEEGSDVILPCSLITKENIESKLFDWKKDGQMEVFLYDNGNNYNNGRLGQDDQFKDRVSHFEKELKYGNASILITHTKMADSGNYSCDFPRLRQIFHIWLVVDRDPQRPTLKDQSGQIRGAAPKPCITIVNNTEDGMLLMCEVFGAFPKPTLEWLDGDGNVLPADQQHDPERSGHYYVTLLITVTKRLRCEAKQEAIDHISYAEIHGLVCGVSENLFTAKEWMLGILVGVAIGVFSTLIVVYLLLPLCGAPKCFTKQSNKDSEKPNGTSGKTHQCTNGVSEEPSSQQLLTRV
ncbi:butyrophilin-like protein 10 [Seriola lalandi dorsalis]|uniref:butyrophilin-like protein 10 n=1 Tax=Seriola lalandi dorsalis TaxID=1841481 RepID=UPI000C6F5DA3|nr:butyrophilin-like protein 10 [Seriola lalandi dorsalis]